MCKRSSPVNRYQIAWYELVPESMTRPVWPVAQLVEPAGGFARLRERVATIFVERLAAMDITGGVSADLDTVYLPLAAWIAARKGHEPLIVGINGAQGSGKSTTCAWLQLLLEHGFGLRVAGFSIDDIYKTRGERSQMAAHVHPLFQTRGVPGTHDTKLGIATLAALRRGDDCVALPSFDKANDDRQPEQAWPVFRGLADVIIFEGWCVGAVAQQAAALEQPVNELEAVEDHDGTWRRYVNDRLADDYAELFKWLDTLIMLRVPSMDSVFEWRGLQEQKLAAAAATGSQLMSTTQLRRFIQHYERLTRWMLEEMPQRANATLFLNAAHRVERICVAG